MTADDLAAIERRAADALRHGSHSSYNAGSATDVPALVAEVRRLQQAEPALQASLCVTVAQTELAASRLQRAEAAEARVAELATHVLRLAVFADPDPVARFDELAARFYSATGIMAPGKSVALEMASSQPPDEVRRDRYWAWVAQHAADLHAAALAALPDVEENAGG